MEELDRLKWYIRLLGEAVDSEEHPITALVIALNWSEEDLKTAQDIFEKYDQQMEKGGALNGRGLEKELRDEFAIGYQRVKQIINAFFHNGQWPNVCLEYARQFRCAEFHGILGV